MGGRVFHYLHCDDYTVKLSITSRHRVKNHRPAEDQPLTSLEDHHYTSHELILLKTPRTLIKIFQSMQYKIITTEKKTLAWEYSHPFKTIRKSPSKRCKQTSSHHNKVTKISIERRAASFYQSDWIHDGSGRAGLIRFSLVYKESLADLSWNSTWNVVVQKRCRTKMECIRKSILKMYCGYASEDI